MESLDVLVFDIGLMYCITFLGISIGILLSSIILNQPSMVQSSQLTATYSIFVVCLSQSIASVVFYYIYYANGDTVTITTLSWSILGASRFILGLGIGFIESALDNLLFEWFVIVDEPFFISTARPWTLFSKELGHCSARLILVPVVYWTVSHQQNMFYSFLFGVVLCALSWTLFSKELGHCSARLILVPVVYWTVSHQQNMFYSFLFGAVLCALSWLSMVCAAVKDSKHVVDERNSNEANIELTSDDDLLSSLSSAGTDSQQEPLLCRQRVPLVNKNKWMMQKIALGILSYEQWFERGCDGFNVSVLLSILYLSVNFGISFCFIVLSVVSFVEQYGYTEYTANLLMQHTIGEYDMQWLAKRIYTVAITIGVGRSMHWMDSILCYLYIVLVDQDL
eukprot:613699_1